MTFAEETIDLQQMITLGIIFQRNGLALQMINARQSAGIKKKLL